MAETEADVYSVLEKNGGKCSDVLVSLEMFLVENIHSGKYSTVDKLYNLLNVSKYWPAFKLAWYKTLKTRSNL